MKMSQKGPLIENEQFRFALSFKRLLRLASQFVQVLQADSTYKLIWNNNLVMISGNTDQQNQFHPIILAVCTNERHNDYQFLFDSLQKGLQLIDKLSIVYFFYANY